MRSVGRSCLELTTADGVTINEESIRELMNASRRARKEITAAFAVQRMILAFIGSAKYSTKTEKSGKPATRRAKSKPLANRLQPGAFIDGVFTGHEGNLAYKLYTPQGSTRWKLPLVVMLHVGGRLRGGNGGMNKLADEIGFLVPRNNR